MSRTLFKERPSQGPASSAVTATPTPPAPPRGFIHLQVQPLLAYFVLVVALSWGTFLLLTGGLGPIGTTDPRFLFIAFTRL